MKRRNADYGKLRRPMKRNKITEGMYGSTTVLYMKFLILWAIVMVADFMFMFRFEFLWPFWLLLRSVHDSFKYKGLAFSVLFVCIAITSDLVCLFFIPVHWLLFLASTYVWVQYVWHTDKGICLPTIILWMLFVYLEVGIRWKDSRHMPHLDLCRPFAAHCIGYPVVTLGFGFKSYVGYRMRQRKQREVAKENEFYMQLLQQALPAEEASDETAATTSTTSTAATTNANANSSTVVMANGSATIGVAAAAALTSSSSVLGQANGILVTAQNQHEHHLNSSSSGGAGANSTTSNSNHHHQHHHHHQQQQQSNSSSNNNNNIKDNATNDTNHTTTAAAGTPSSSSSAKHQQSTAASTATTTSATTTGATLTSNYSTGFAKVYCSSISTLLLSACGSPLGPLGIGDIDGGFVGGCCGANGHAGGGGGGGSRNHRRSMDKEKHRNKGSSAETDNNKNNNNYHQVDTSTASAATSAATTSNSKDKDKEKSDWDCSNSNYPQQQHQQQGAKDKQEKKASSSVSNGNVVQIDPEETSAPEPTPQVVEKATKSRRNRGKKDNHNSQQQQQQQQKEKEQSSSNSSNNNNNSNTSNNNNNDASSVSSSASSTTSSSNSNSNTNNNNNKNAIISQLASKVVSKICETCLKLEADVKKYRAEISHMKQIENELRQKLDVNLTSKSLLQAKQKECDELEKRVQEQTNTRHTDMLCLQSVERRLHEERRQKQSLDAQLTNEKKARKAAEEKAARPECSAQCKQRRQQMDEELKRLRQELKQTEEAKQLAVEHGRKFEQEYHMLEAEMRNREASQSDTELLMNALATMQDKNKILEKNLSAETRVKLDLFSALGAAKRQLEISECNRRSKEDEVIDLKAKIAQLLAVMPDSMCMNTGSASSMLRMNDTPPLQSGPGPASPLLSLSAAGQDNNSVSSIQFSGGMSLHQQQHQVPVSQQQQQQMVPVSVAAALQVAAANVNGGVSTLDPNASVYTPKAGNMMVVSPVGMNPNGTDA
ncbi:macoilin-2 isoform X1 [Drosophila tropicalis]|uniref:macoilin-2 isoform X1 n=1 Tax=Drosophila tropicalis TaxID=46794 RepID=UPI0035AC1309